MPQLSAAAEERKTEAGRKKKAMVFELAAWRSTTWLPMAAFGG